MQTNRFFNSKFNLLAD